MTEPSAESLTGPLPGPVRGRVVALASEALGAFTSEEVPPSLRAVARFAPAKRARAGGGQLAASLESDPVFRQRVAVWVRDRFPELSATIEAGAAPAAADPTEVAALAYLLRPTGWTASVERAASALLEDSRSTEQAEQERLVRELRDQLDQARRGSRAEVEAARAELAASTAEAADLRRRLRTAEAEVGRALAARDRLAKDAEQAAAAAAGAATTAAAQERRLRAQLAAAEATVESARRVAREGRTTDEMRLRLLLDTVLDAAAGLRRELALPPAGSQRPADGVGAQPAGVAGVDDLANRGLDVLDPGVLDQLLALPQAHLVVDGYNVTKTGYGTLTLEDQRRRLLAGLAALAGRTGVEVTCVFDGTTLAQPVLSSAPRGVRVLFSVEGETADELIRRLVRAEPAGRPVIVVSTDAEVADGVRRSGARPVPSLTLLRRLERG